MAEKLYKYTEVTGTALAETTVPFLTSTEVEKKNVHELWVYESTPTRQNNAIIRVYLEREKIAEIPIRAFLDQSANQVYPDGAGRIPIERTLEIGQTLSVGHISGSTASNLTFVAVYELAR